MSQIKEKSGGTREASVFLLPIMAVFVALYAVPLAMTFYYSLTEFEGFTRKTTFVGLANYREIFARSDLLSGLSYTVLFMVATTLLVTVCAVPLAVLLNKKFMGRAVVRSLFFFLGVPSAAILGLVWAYIFSPLKSGAINTILEKIGISPIEWLADATIARWCVIFVAVWAAVGWHATLYIAYLQSIPSDLYESAEVDGASSVQQFFQITVPQLMPAIVVSTFLLISSGLKVYDLPFAMTKGGPGYATNTVTQSIILQGISQGHYGLGSALAVVFTIVCFVIVLTQVYLAGLVGKRFE